MSEPWIERWQEGRIGWHEARGNASLRRHWGADGRRVLVPLCGKSVDLLWLAERGHEVVGVELSQIAVLAFFSDNQLAFHIEDGDSPVYHGIGLPVSIVCGDYLDYRGGPFDAYYDRGALVALPASLRPDYVRHSKSLLADDAELLLITLEYDQDRVDGPPFSVPGSEVRQYWPSLRCVDEYNDIDNAPPKFRNAGLDGLYERVWLSG